MYEAVTIQFSQQVIALAVILAPVKLQTAVIAHYERQTNQDKFGTWMKSRTPQELV